MSFIGIFFHQIQHQQQKGDLVYHLNWHILILNWIVTKWRWVFFNTVTWKWVGHSKPILIIFIKLLNFRNNSSILGSFVSIQLNSIEHFQIVSLKTFKTLVNIYFFVVAWRIFGMSISVSNNNLVFTELKLPIKIYFQRFQLHYSKWGWKLWL